MKTKTPNSSENFTRVFYFVTAILAIVVLFEKVGACHIRHLWGQPTSQVRVLTIENYANWPFYHTALELSHPGFNRTYGFFSTMPKPMYWFWGWTPHEGKVLSPDLFFSGSPNGTIGPGVIKDPVITLQLNSTQTTALKASIQEMLKKPGFYSYINRNEVDNCVSWVTNLLNPILDGEYLDCTVASWFSLEVPSGCRLIIG